MSFIAQYYVSAGVCNSNSNLLLACLRNKTGAEIHAISNGRLAVIWVVCLVRITLPIQLQRAFGVV